MPELSALRRLHRRLMKPAAALVPEQAELYAVTFYACVIGLLSYLAYIPLFLGIGAPHMAALNVGVVMVFGGAVVIVRRGRVFTGMVAASVALAGHAWVAATTFGAEAAFQVHVVLALELGLLFTYVPLRIRLVYASAFALGYVGLVLTLSRTAPAVDLSREMTEFFELLNSTIFVAVTILIATFFAWSVRKNREAREALVADLARARDEAQSASKAKSMFLANMSHELRTPLNAIIGYGELIAEDAEDNDDAELADQVARIGGAGRHLLGLINEILDLAKIEAGRMDLDTATFELAETVDAVVATVRPLASSKRNRLVVDLAPDLPPVSSDATKIRQILLNLLSNACKFTEDGEIGLRIHPELCDGTQGVRIEVTDTGIGIPADKLEHIFDEFAQADSSTTRRFGGTGLGLAITRRFVEMLGGTIDVESEPGRGSTFVVWVPADGMQERRGD